MTLRTKLRLVKLAILAGSSLLLLVVLEFSIRKLFPYFDPQGPHQITFHFNPDGVPLGPENRTVRQRSPQGDYDLPVSFNRYGFRDIKDLTTSKSTDWFVVGDSYSMGWGVEETKRFSSLLEKSAPFHVFNICVPTDIAGYGQLVDYAEHHGATVSNLVIGICMENDLRDYYALNPSALPASKAPLKERARSFVKAHSAVYLLLSTELQQSEWLHRFFVAIGVARKLDSEYQMHFNRFDEPAIHYSVELLDKLIAGRRRVIVLIVPSRGLWIGKYRDVEAKVHDLFVNEVRKKNVEVVDMKPIFEATGDPMQFHFKHDGHWSEKGHRLAAQYLAQQIQSGR